MDNNKKFMGFTAAERPTTGIAMIFDVAGFTTFFNKPDLQNYITKYLNHIIECVEMCIYGGIEYWTGDASSELKPLLVIPNKRKFLGDGMLYIWEDIETDKKFTPSVKITLLNRLWNLQKYVSKINDELINDLPVADLPKALKFGLAQGTIYRLTETDGTVDYIGPCINLASRLVKYCPDINFICSARLNFTHEVLKKHNWMRIIAKELRSFENDIVIIDPNDFKRISSDEKKRLFQTIGK